MLQKIAQKPDKILLIEYCLPLLRNILFPFFWKHQYGNLIPIHYQFCLSNHLLQVKNQRKIWHLLQYILQHLFEELNLSDCSNVEVQLSAEKGDIMVLYMDSSFDIAHNSFYTNIKLNLNVPETG